MPKRKPPSALAIELRAAERSMERGIPRDAVPLTYPLPRSNTVLGPRGWYTTPWTKETRAEAEAHRYKLVEKT